MVRSAWRPVAGDAPGVVPNAGWALWSIATVSATSGAAGGGCHAGMSVVDSRASPDGSDIIIVAATSGTTVSSTSGNGAGGGGAGASQGRVACASGAGAASAGDEAPAASTASVELGSGA